MLNKILNFLVIFWIVLFICTVLYWLGSKLFVYVKKGICFIKTYIKELKNDR